VVCLPALTACANGSHRSRTTAPPLSGPRLVARAANRTTAAKSATVFVSLVATGAPQGGSGRVDAFGAVDLAAGRADLTFDLSGLAPDAPRNLSARVLGAVSYLDFAGTPLPGGATLPAGKHWVRIDSTSAPGFDSLSPFGDMNTHPTRPLQALGKMGPTVRSIGSEKLKGVTTTRYRGDVGLVDVLRPVTAGMPAAQQQAAREALIKLDGVRLPVDVWIDGDGRARRLEITITAAAFAPVEPSAAGDHTIITSSVEFSDFGRPVHVVVPPVGETVPVASVPHLAEALGASAGPSVTPTGPWTTVQTGSTQGIDWVVLQATASDAAGVCTGLDIGTRVPSGQPGDFDCLDRNSATDPITIYGSDVTGSKTYVFGTAIPAADRLVITAGGGSKVDATLRSGTFVAFLGDGAQVARIDAFAGSRPLGSCTNTSDTTTSTTRPVDTPC
jgi:hypothetical protein